MIRIPAPYAPLFMTLAGRIGGPPSEGFGAEYKGSFRATRLVRVSPNGKALARKCATAKSAWMTRDFVPFEGTLDFDPPPAGEKGMLILRKNNPSEDRKLDDQLAIPVLFRRAGATASRDGDPPPFREVL